MPMIKTPAGNVDINVLTALEQEDYISIKPKLEKEILKDTMNNRISCLIADFRELADTIPSSNAKQVINTSITAMDTALESLVTTIMSNM